MSKKSAPLLITSLLFLLSRFGESLPVNQGLEKRDPLYCFPINPPTPFFWWDCANAVLQINAESPNSNNVPYIFGTELGATYSNDVYQWESG